MSPLIAAPPAEPVGGGPAHPPTLRIDRWCSSVTYGLRERSELVLSMTAYRALGRPAYVRIQYNAMKQMIRLQTFTTAVDGARQLKPKPRSGGMAVSGIERLIKHGGIRPGKYVMVRPGIFIKVSVDRPI